MANENSDTQSLRDFLRNARQQIGLSRRELANAIGTTVGFVEAWETGGGSVTPARQLLPELSRVLSVDFAMLQAKYQEARRWARERYRSVSDQTREALLERWRAGDLHAGSELLESFEAIIHEFVRSHRALKISPENIRQQVYVGLLQSLKRYKIGEGHITHFVQQGIRRHFARTLFKIAGSIVRHAQTEDVSIEGLASRRLDEGERRKYVQLPSQITPEDILVKKDLDALRHRWLMNALDDLKPRERQIFERIYLAEEGERPSYSDIAAEDGVSKQAIQQLVAKAYKRVQAGVYRQAVARRDRYVLGLK